MEPLMKYISRISRLVELYRNERIKEFGLTGAQHIYILNICQNPGVTQEQLAGQIYVNKSNVARQLAALEKSGFITRTADESDKRQLKVFPTQRALDTLPKVREILRELNVALLDGFTQEEQDALTSMLCIVLDKSIAIADTTPINRKDLLP